jgi:hypothetical protein
MQFRFLLCDDITEMFSDILSQVHRLIIELPRTYQTEDKFYF